MENKYCIVHTTPPVSNTGTLSELLKEREQLRHRCHVIGNKLSRLPGDVKKFENYEFCIKHYDF